MKLERRVKGASTWITALPLKSLNYVLNKQDFQDSISWIRTRAKEIVNVFEMEFRW